MEDSEIIETITLSIGPLEPYLNFRVLQCLGCVCKSLSATCRIYLDKNTMKLNGKALYNHQRGIVNRLFQQFMNHIVTPADLSPDQFVLPAISRREKASGKREQYKIETQAWTTFIDADDDDDKDSFKMPFERTHSFTQKIYPARKWYLEAYMGFGKTITALKLAEMVCALPRGKVGDYTYDRQNVIVVVPPDVFPVWHSEIEKFFPGHRKTRNYDEHDFCYCGKFDAETKWIRRYDKRLFNYCEMTITGIGREVLEDNNLCQEIEPRQTNYPCRNRITFLGLKSYNSIRHDGGTCGPSLFALERGRVIIVSTTYIRKIPTIIANARLIIVDEAHNLSKYETKLIENANVNMIHMSGSPMPGSTKSNTIVYSSEETKRRPDFEIDVINPTSANASIESAVKDIISKVKDRHIVVAMSSAFRRGTFAIDHMNNSLSDPLPVHIYDNYQVTIMRAFQEHGGVLVSTIQKICKGNSFNKCSLMIILNTVNQSITREDIIQCTGRIRRDSNNNGIVRIILLDYSTNRSTYLTSQLLRHRLNTGIDLMANREFVTSAVWKMTEAVLESAGYELSNLTMDEILILFSRGPAIDVHKTTIPAKLLLQILSILN